MIGDQLLEVQDIGKSFGGLQALKDVTFQVEEGAIHAIIGPNGAGKSTLLNVMIGMIAPDQGYISFGGRPIIGDNPYDGTKLRKMPPHEIIQRGLARVFQTPQIFPALSLLDNVTITMLAKRDGQFAFKAWESLSPTNPTVAEAAQFLQRLGLGKAMHRQAQHLSRGDKRRLELAMCLSTYPRLLLLDESTAGMSRHDTNRTIDLLKDIHSTGMTMVVIEHDMHVVFSLAQKITVLAQGRVIASGQPEEVRADAKVREAYLGGAH
jgi:branched-chain amino acid transport system ATP-binding protein